MVVVPVVGKPAPVCLHEGEILCPGFRDQFAVPGVSHIPVVFADLEGKGAAADDDALRIFVHLERSCGGVDLKCRLGVHGAQMMVGLHADDLIHGGGDDQRQVDAAERVASVVDARRRGADRHLVRLNFCKICLLWCEAFTAFLLEPAAVTEFHDLFSAPVFVWIGSFQGQITAAPGTVRVLYENIIPYIDENEMK